MNLQIISKKNNWKNNLEEIEKNFTNVINGLTKKEELKKIIIEGVFTNDNDNSSKNDIKQNQI